MNLQPSSQPVTSAPPNTNPTPNLNNEDDEDEETVVSQSLPESGGPTFLARQSLQILLKLLCRKVPLEIALQIIETADIYPCSILASRQKTEMEIFSLDGGKRTYLTAQIPYFDNPRNLRNFKRPARPSSQSDPETPQKRIINKLVFRIRTQRSYQSIAHTTGISFLEVEVWRRKYDGYKQDILLNYEKQLQQIRDQGGNVDDINGNYNVNIRSSEAWNKECHDFYHGYSRGGTKEETKGQKGKFKVGTWFLMRMEYTEAKMREYTVVWNWKHDEPLYIDDEDSDRKIKGRCFKPWFDNCGPIENGAFIRELQEGDELKVVMRSLGGNHRCIVSACEIECWWAL
ncbi:hypothetical protein TWF718_007457 [Orbilia javanica]|uniref:Uncharacterized protein n=1 Tax=Orbilia javanica TaxID=47235 RepID=A0AAN8MRI0_9PEZI